MNIRLILYDMTSDNGRTKVAKKLEAYGLQRLQFSVFCGCHTDAKWDSLWAKLEKLFMKYRMEGDSLYCISLGAGQLKKMWILGSPPDFEYLTGEIKTLWI